MLNVPAQSATSEICFTKSPPLENKTCPGYALLGFMGRKLPIIREGLQALLETGNAFGMESRTCCAYLVEW